MLVYQRKSLWFKDTLDKLAAWLNLRHGMTVVDVGCGLGYLGYTYWPYFGRQGTYIGVDGSLKLLIDARAAAKRWAANKRVRFIAGDAYKLPLPDNIADVTMCQTLLIHLEKPERAVSEMIRVTRPGGLVVCHEPDNISPRLSPFHSSLPELKLEELLLFSKILLTANKGRIRMGLGDLMFGPRVPGLMSKLGLIDIEVRLNDRVFYIEPPYETSLQKQALENVKKELLDKTRAKIRREREKKEFLAGGGDIDEYKKWLPINKRIMRNLRKQADEGRYAACGSSDFYVSKGTKAG